MNANELYPIVKPAIIVGFCGQTGFVRSFIEHAILRACHYMFIKNKYSGCITLPNHIIM